MASLPSLSPWTNAVVAQGSAQPVLAASECPPSMQTQFSDVAVAGSSVREASLSTSTVPSTRSDTRHSIPAVGSKHTPSSLGWFRGWLCCAAAPRVKEHSSTQHVAVEYGLSPAAAPAQSLLKPETCSLNTVPSARDEPHKETGVCRPGLALQTEAQVGAAMSGSQAAEVPVADATWTESTGSPAAYQSVSDASDPSVFAANPHSPPALPQMPVRPPASSLYRRRSPQAQPSAFSEVVGTLSCMELCAAPLPPTASTTHPPKQDTCTQAPHDGAKYLGELQPIARRPSGLPTSNQRPRTSSSSGDASTASSALARAAQAATLAVKQAAGIITPEDAPRHSPYSPSTPAPLQPKPSTCSSDDDAAGVPAALPATHPPQPDTPVQEAPKVAGNQLPALPCEQPPQPLAAPASAFASRQDVSIRSGKSYQSDSGEAPPHYCLAGSSLLSVGRRVSLSRTLNTELEEEAEEAEVDADEGSLELSDANLTQGSVGDAFWDATSHHSSASWLSSSSNLQQQQQQVTAAPPFTNRSTPLYANRLSTDSQAMHNRSSTDSRANTVFTRSSLDSHVAPTSAGGTRSSSDSRQLPSTSSIRLMGKMVAGPDTPAGVLQFTSSHLLPDTVLESPIEEVHSSSQFQNLGPAGHNLGPMSAFLPSFLPNTPAFKSASLPPGVCGPDKPLPFIDPSTVWQPFPASTGFSGYWSKVAHLSSPLPMPIDVMLGASWLARKAHESIQGIKITELPEELSVTAKVSVLGAAIIHKEVYPKDGSPNMGMLRRDVKPGRVAYRAFFTARHELVLVVDAYDLLGWLDTSGVEVIRLHEDGNSITCLQACYVHSQQKSAVQTFVGRREAQL